MIIWWTSLSLAMKILWGITIAATLIFVIQSVMTFLGADVDGGIDAPDAGFDDPTLADAGSNLYTFRNLVNFLLGFGWTAVLLRSEISSTIVLFLVATVVGLALVAAVMWLFKMLNSMQQSGNIDVFKSAVGCQGKAYLTIPARRSGSGKVQISISDAVREYDALTDGDEIPTGTPVKVVEVLDASTLLVVKMES